MRESTKASILKFPLADDQGDWTIILNKYAHTTIRCKWNKRVSSLCRLSEMRNWIISLSLSLCLFSRMVSSYLVHHGYSTTAESFARATEQNLNEEMSSIKTRQSKSTVWNWFELNWTTTVAKIILLLNFVIFSRNPKTCNERSNGTCNRAHTSFLSRITRKQSKFVVHVEVQTICWNGKWFWFRGKWHWICICFRKHFKFEILKDETLSLEFKWWKQKQISQHDKQLSRINAKLRLILALSSHVEWNVSFVNNSHHHHHNSNKQSSPNVSDPINEILSKWITNNLKQ